MELKKVVIFDLDGTIRRAKKGRFISELSELELIPDAALRIKEILDAGYVIYGMTNQGGVAHKFKTRQDVLNENHRTIELLKDELHSLSSDGDIYTMPIQKIFFSISHEKAEGVLGKRSAIRKPSIGCFALVEHHLGEFRCFPDWDNSFFIGDMKTDCECAMAFDVNFVWAEDFLAYGLKKFITAEKAILNTYNPVLGNKMRYERKLIGLTQTEMGRRIGASRAMISMAERGYINMAYFKFQKFKNG